MELPILPGQCQQVEVIEHRNELQIGAIEKLRKETGSQVRFP